ncbi:MAG: EAL domain-containing protein [Burkholderiales bacterium]
MKIEGSFLQSKVARRVFALFVLTALIPVAFISVFSHYQVTRLLTEQTQRELALFGASYGSSSYERLLLAERTLGNVVVELARDLPADQLAKLFSPVIRAAVQQSPSGERKAVFGKDFNVGKLSEAEYDQLRRGMSVLQISASAERDGVVVLLLAIDAAQIEKGWVAVEVNPAYLWADQDELPYMISVCVLDSANHPLFCSNREIKQAVVRTAASVSAKGARSQNTLQAGNVAYFAAFREIFVASKFGKHHWTVVATRPESEALAPVSVFSIIFWGSVLLSVLVVMLLSVSQIRRTLIPLESLMAATRRIAKRDFSTPVEVKRGDEFGELADTFNTMSTRLNRQFTVLSVLSRIDRSILSDLNVAYVIDEVLSRLPELVKTDFAAIFVLKHDSERDGAIHFASATHGRQKVMDIAIGDDVRELLLQHAAGQWGATETAAPLYQTFRLTTGDARRLFVLPVMWKDQLCGAMLLGWQDEVTLDEEDIAHVRDFADRVGVVLSSSAREARLFYQARYDALTDLPNRYLFMERLAQEISRAQRESRQLVVLFVALDRFKNVNDTLGHAAGDALIQETSVRLRKHLREGDTLSRFGGQEFAIVLSGALGPKQAEVVARNVIAALAEPFVIEQVESFITAGVGIAIYPDDGANAANVLRNADTACAKASGRSTFVYFTEGMNQQAVRRASLERELRRAIEQRQFMLYYQPKVDFQSGRIVGTEALIRWQHPEAGVVNPGGFIDVAEDTGLIVEMGRFALEEGCRQFRDWRERDIRLNHIAINVSSRQFRSGNVLDDVCKNLLANDFRPGELELEVTESLMVDNFDDVTRLLKEFRAYGASIALDDFGTGYSSMSYLEILPFDTLKIDISFIRPIKENGEGGAIATAIIAMAKSLNKKVVAEGVETQAQVDFLKRLGCNIAQGYFYGKPLPPAEFEALYLQQKQLQ